MRTITITLAFFGLLASTALAADAVAGKATYDKSCKSCHGADGTPNASVAKMMKVDMKDLKSPEIQGGREADLKRVVTEGKGKMKPVKTVTSSDLDNVIAYIYTLKK